MHDPAHAEAVTEARRLGGNRRKREVTVRGAFEVEDLRGVEGAQRVLEIALLDLLALDNSVPRDRSLIAGALAVLKANEVGDLVERIKALEAAVQANRGQTDSLYEQADDFALEQDG
jgi:hypothetical protein